MEKEIFLQKVLEAENTLFHVSFSILRNEQDCADAVQEAILKAYASRDSLKNTDYFRTWIVRIVINECYGLLRKRRVYEEYDENLLWDPSSSGGYVKEEYLDLYNAIEKLERRERDCVVLYYLEDFPVEEIAGILKIPSGTVKSRLSRARKQLKGLLA